MIELNPMAWIEMDDRIPIYVVQACVKDGVLSESGIWPWILHGIAIRNWHDPV